MPAKLFPRILLNIPADHQGIAKQFIRTGFYAGADAFDTGKNIQPKPQGIFIKNGAYHTALVSFNSPGLPHKFQNPAFQVIYHPGISTAELRPETEKKQEPDHGSSILLYLVILKIGMVNSSVTGEKI
jgi:hypothetical protein